MVSQPTVYPVAFVAFVFIVCGGILNFWRSGQREQQRMQANEGGHEKRQLEEARYFATPEHGRLEIMEDDSPVFEKRKR